MSDKKTYKVSSPNRITMYYRAESPEAAAQEYANAVHNRVWVTHDHETHVFEVDQIVREVLS